jgi:DNA-binding CsgD family transcriptional regulator
MKKELFDKRDLHIIRLICREYSTGEIAEATGVSYKRVESLRSELLKKTKSKNVVGIVKYAIKHKIFPLK